MVGDCYQSNWLITKTLAVSYSTENAVTLWVGASISVKIILNSVSLHLVLWKPVISVLLRQKYSGMTTLVSLALEEVWERICKIRWHTTSLLGRYKPLTEGGADFNWAKCFFTLFQSVICLENSWQPCYNLLQLRNRCRVQILSI